MRRAVQGGFEEVKERTIDALKTQGFGILSEIDVQKTLREKLDAELEPYQILGACNPQLALQALTAERSIGLLLPCNVVLRGLGNAVEVSILDPEVMFAVASEATRAQLESLAHQARARLSKALESV